MPGVGPLGVKDFVLVKAPRAHVLKLERQGVCVVLFFDSAVVSQTGILNYLGSVQGAQSYSLDVRRFRAVAASSLGTTTEIRSTPKIVAYVNGDPVKMFSTNLPKTKVNIQNFVDSVLSEFEEEEPPPPPRRQAGSRRGAQRPPPRQVYEEDPDDGSEFIVPPGVKPHNTPWVEIDEEF